MCQGLSVTRSLLKIGGHRVKVGKNGGLSVKMSEKKIGSFWWHMAHNPKLSAPRELGLPAAHHISFRLNTNFWLNTDFRCLIPYSLPYNHLALLKDRFLEKCFFKKSKKPVAFFS